MARTEPRRGTPEGDQFDGKVFMALGVVAGLLLAAADYGLFALLIGGVTFLVGAMKYHAGLVRRRG